MDLVRTERQRRRVNWYDHGVHAIACVVSQRPPEAYLCPLCLNFFTKEQLDTGELTDEHVPPKAVGGKPLVLTCKSCNKASGGLLDEAMTDEERLRTFGTPHSLGPLPGSATVDRFPNNGSIGFDGKSFVMSGHRDQNNPATLAAHTESLQGLPGGSVIELRFRFKLAPRRAGFGWMRSAYLAAFATYGYRYVLQPAFAALRAAIADPDAPGFDPVVLQAPDDGGLDPLIAEVTAPPSLAGCVAVVFGPRLILLPTWCAPEDWFATLRHRLTNEAAQNLALLSVIGRRFPESPMYLADS
jgi:hypothetical protein